MTKKRIKKRKDILFVRTREGKISLLVTYWKSSRVVTSDQLASALLSLAVKLCPRSHPTAEYFMLPRNHKECSALT